jgi:hypothetical protein
MTVAVLFADPRGCYSNLPGVDLWDEKRDARLYAGPWPVVAHPPCSRWCQLAHAVQGRYGHRVGDDGGCFESALASVRRWGGVLEHPAYSLAWAAYGIARPHRAGGWQRLACGGATCYVEQGRYGHPAKKATWLYAHGVELPELRWGHGYVGTHLVSWMSNHVPETETRPRVGKAVASRTPDAFRDALLSIARTAPSARA